MTRIWELVFEELNLNHALAFLAENSSLNLGRAVFYSLRPRIDGADHSLEHSSSLSTNSCEDLQR